MTAPGSHSFSRQVRRRLATCCANHAPTAVINRPSCHPPSTDTEPAAKTPSRRKDKLSERIPAKCSVPKFHKNFIHTEGILANPTTSGTFSSAARLRIDTLPRHPFCWASHRSAKRALRRPFPSRSRPSHPVHRRFPDLTIHLAPSFR